MPEAPEGTPIPTPPAGYRTELKNFIDVDIQKLPAGATATAGLRFCNCADSPGLTSTEGGRAECRTKLNSPCVYSATAYGAGGSVWKQIKTPRTLNSDGTENWTNPQTGREWTGLGASGFATSWDFRALGSAVTTTSTSQSVKGILWATIRNVSTTIGGITPADIESRAATLGTGNARWRHVQNSTNPIWQSTEESIYCPRCPQRVLSPYFEISNPEWRQPIDLASIPVDPPDANTAKHYEEVVLGTVRNVPASEPLAILAKTIRAGQPKARSVGVEGEAVTRVLRTDRLDQVPVRAAFSSVNGGPPAALNRGYTFSASKQRLYVIGGRVNAGRFYVPANEGWMLDIVPRTWRRWSFSGDESVGGVLTAAYRWQDQAVYFVDTSASVLRLRRWNAQQGGATGAVQTLATFPTSWNAFAKFDLLSTVDGGLLLVASAGTGSEKNRIGRFVISPARTVSLVGLKKSTSTELLGRPSVGETGYTMLRLPTGTGTQTKPYSSSVLFASMGAAGTADAPTIQPH